ncbi:MAG: hypothetical protein Q7J32_06010 [Sphingomonadaceae bacterium]|nr:hypothetical protein [Sphingomonadaceae bacterium]
MEDVVLPIAVIALLLLALRTVLAFFSGWINARTIREAIKNERTDVVELAAALQGEPPPTAGVVGVMFLAMGLALLLGAFLTDGAERTESIRLALIALLVGGAMAFYQWRRRR